jgi:hypothetical protein
MIVSVDRIVTARILTARILTARILTARIFFWREGLEGAFGPERRGRKGVVCKV